MSNRKRKKQILFMVNDSEYQQIERRMKNVGIVSKRAYLLKMALNGYIYHIELDPVREMVRLLSNATNNINQIAKKANETGVVTNEEISYLARKIDDIWVQSKQTLNALSEIIK